MPSQGFGLQRLTMGYDGMHNTHKSNYTWDGIHNLQETCVCIVVLTVSLTMIHQYAYFTKFYCGTTSALRG